MFWYIFLAWNTYTSGYNAACVFQAITKLKLLDLSRFKASEDDKINLTEKINSKRFLERVETLRESVGHKVLYPFYTMLSN